MNKFKRFETPDDVYEWIKSAYPSDTLSLFDINTISYDSPLSWYVGSFSSTINENLRKGKLVHHTYHYESLQNDLCKQSMPDNIIVYRYMSLKEFIILWLNTTFGRIYKNPGFLSTTVLPEYFNGQAASRNFCVPFYAHFGCHGIYLPDLISGSVHEYEVLFAHHSSIVRKGLFDFFILPDLPDEEYCGMPCSQDVVNH